MNRPTAERLMSATLALDPLLNEIDQIISNVPDETERSALAATLGNVFGELYLGFARPIEHRFPDLAEKH